MYMKARGMFQTWHFLLQCYCVPNVIFSKLSLWMSDCPHLSWRGSWCPTRRGWGGGRAGRGWRCARLARTVTRSDSPGSCPGPRTAHCHSLRISAIFLAIIKFLVEEISSLGTSLLSIRSDSGGLKLFKTSITESLFLIEIKVLPFHKFPLLWSSLSKLEDFL